MRCFSNYFKSKGIYPIPDAKTFWNLTEDSESQFFVNANGRAHDLRGVKGHGLFSIPYSEFNTCSC